MAEGDKVRPKNFYLNEQHELSRGESKGGGRTPNYVPIDWKARGSQIDSSLQQVKKSISVSVDPSKDSHYFILAKPVHEVKKISIDKTKAPDGTLTEETDFSTMHSRVFSRLNMDLLRVTEDGSAIVHMKPETLEQLSNSSKILDELSPREQSRWATIDDFSMIPTEARIDKAWIESLNKSKSADAVIEFQPFLNRAEIDRLLRTLAGRLQGASEQITGTGADFSGRQWIRGRLLRQSLSDIAETYFSVQSLHSPLISKVAGSISVGIGGQGAQSGGTLNVSTLPIIAVVDTGVALDHAVLSPYRRGTYVAPNTMANNPDPHGCFVASRAVFGDLDFSNGLPSSPPQGSARFYDVNICGINPGEIDGKSVSPGLLAVVGTAPDVRVFNFSFDTTPLDLFDQVKRSEFLSLVQDLDNFIFQNDILVVICTGNSGLGVIPSTPYPNHMADPAWQLGAWSRSFNSLTCGSAVQNLSSGGLVTELGWPSAFTRLGPGLCGSPKPDFVANGGNSTQSYTNGAGLGVWGLSPAAMWEDHIGTSNAAPLLSREVAYALSALDSVCAQGSRPFGVTVKAFLALTAEPTASSQSLKPIQALATRALGRGYASANRFGNPSAHSAVLIWQGVLESDKDVARVKIPIPKEWVLAASGPCLRIVVSWDPPVNAALSGVWATRRVNCQLRERPDVRAHRTNNIGSNSTYPQFERLYILSKVKPPTDDIWILDISYEQIGEYYPAMQFANQQRVAFAAELIDIGGKGISPQVAIQAMPIAETMTRLSLPSSATRTPIFLKALV